MTEFELMLLLFFGFTAIVTSYTAVTSKGFLIKLISALIALVCFVGLLSLIAK